MWKWKKYGEMGNEGRDTGYGLIIFFFFKQKTAYEIYQCDWSSDVCSSDLTTSFLYSGLRKSVKGFPICSSFE